MNFGNYELTGILFLNLRKKFSLFDLISFFNLLKKMAIEKIL